MLVLGAGIAGIEAARILAGRGHDVEVWEKADRPGGQMPLATAAPDKREVDPIWSYCWSEVQALGVPIRLSTLATAAAVRAFAPDFAIVATGAAPRPAPFDISALDPRIRVMHAWEYLADPGRIESAAQVTIVGGGMVGMEAADLLLARGARVTVLEALPTMAQGMARNNRMELIERVQARGARLVTECGISGARGTSLEIRTQSVAAGNRHPRASGNPESSESLLEIGDVLLIAIGPAPVRAAVQVLEEAGVAYEMIGDCCRPGDFLTAIRDAWMVALSVEQRTAAAVHEPAATGRGTARA